MKKIASMFLLTATLFGSMAFAGPQAVVEFNDAGIPVLQPLNGYRCEEPVPQPTGTSETYRYCDNGGRKCPPGYDAVAKYCWGGWGSGWHRCGYTCQSNGMYDGGQ
ncbi:hypothetical protein D3C87_124130 [compost metagenome]